MSVFYVRVPAPLVSRVPAPTQGMLEHGHRRSWNTDTGELEYGHRGSWNTDTGGGWNTDTGRTHGAKTLGHSGARSLLILQINWI